MIEGGKEESNRTVWFDCRYSKITVCINTMRFIADVGDSDVVPQSGPGGFRISSRLDLIINN